MNRFMACLPFWAYATPTQAVTKTKATVRPPYTSQPTIPQRFSSLPPAYPELFAVMGGQVPDLRERMPQGSATAGNYRDAGLPNITGEFSYNTATPAIDNNNPYYTGCITAGTRRGNRIYLSSGIGGWAAKIDASRSSEIYGRSLTVQPAAYTVRYLIRAR